jgi:ubiquinone/menaquinone biosynthesis C-methylase UbiE
MFLNENLLEPVARYFRLHVVKPFFSTNHIVADFGCGPSAPFFRHMPASTFKEYIGIDPLSPNRELAPNARVVQAKIEATKLAANSVDRVVMLAVLEHVDDALRSLKEAYRVLKPNGLIVLTTPTPPSKPILEFLSFKLALISPREIEEHKRYLLPSETHELLLKAGFRVADVKTFEFGLNQVAYGKK